MQNSRSEFLLYFNLGECLENITNLNIIEVNKADTALEVGCNFLNVVLVTLQSVDVCGMNHNSVANDTCAVGTVNLSFCNISTGNSSDL